MAKSGYIHHIDGNPRNNERANLVIKRKIESDCLDITYAHNGEDVPVFRDGACTVPWRGPIRSGGRHGFPPVYLPDEAQEHDICYTLYNSEGRYISSTIVPAVNSQISKRNVAAVYRIKG